MDFASWVKGRRTSLGKSQRQLAKDAGLSSLNIISRVERGEILVPRPEILRGLAAGLDVSETVVYVAAGFIPPDIRNFILDHEEGLSFLRETMRSAA